MAQEWATPRLVLVCVLLLIEIVLLVLADQSRLAQSAEVMIAGAAIVAAVSSTDARRDIALGASAVGVLAAIGAAVAVQGDVPQARGGNLIVMTALTLAIPIAVVWGLRREMTVNVHAVVGAVAIYLDIGLMFAMLNSLAAHYTGGDFFAQGGDASMSERVYYSYVTLATLGYGDLTPATGVGRLLSVTESVVGNLYLVTAVSLVVSRIGSPRGGRVRRDS